MPVNEVGIANSALLKLGADIIQSLTQDTRSAKVINAIFWPTVNEVLRSHPWNFAMKRVLLTPSLTTPDFEYAHQFDLPTDCLLVWETSEDRISDEPDYVVEGRKILSNYEEMEVRYIYAHQDPSEWDALFAEALACKLAEKTAYSITKSGEREAAMQKLFKEAIVEARTRDGMEGITRGLLADKWIHSRR